jgi:hypothetical protein
MRYFCSPANFKLHRTALHGSSLAIKRAGGVHRHAEVDPCGPERSCEPERITHGASAKPVEIDRASVAQVERETNPPGQVERLLRRHRRGLDQRRPLRIRQHVDVELHDVPFLARLDAPDPRASG